MAFIFFSSQIDKHSDIKGLKSNFNQFFLIKNLIPLTYIYVIH